MSERSLWSAVLMLAIGDALGNPAMLDACGGTDRKQEKRRVIDEARHWLRLGNRDFQTVCQNAGVDPAYVHAKVTSMIESGATIDEVRASLFAEAA